MPNDSFENRYHISDAMLKEYVNRVLFRRQKWTGAWICVLALVMFVVSYRDKDTFFMAVYAVCFLILACSLLLLGPLAVKQIKDSTQKLHNGKNAETIIRFGDCITMEEGKCQFSVEYSQITCIYCLKHCCVLMFGKRNGILIDPSGFVAGSYAEFLEFIESKVSDKCNHKKRRMRQEDLK